MCGTSIPNGVHFKESKRVGIYQSFPLPNIHAIATVLEVVIYVTMAVHTYMYNFYVTNSIL